MKNDPNNYDHSFESSVSQLPAIGKARRYNNLKKTLSIFFDLVKQTRNEKGQLMYADNLNSKGILKPVFITLTYPDNSYWQPNDITDFLRKIKQYAKRNWGTNLAVAWVAETTKNGVIHYHLLTWIPRNKRLPKPSLPIVITYKNGNTREYPPLWKYHTKIEGVRKGVYGYLLKYISKGCELGLNISRSVEAGYQAIYQYSGYSRLSLPPLYGYKIEDHEQRFADTKDTMSVNIINPRLSIDLPKYHVFKIITKYKTVRPRLFGYSGLNQENRVVLSHWKAPQYIRNAFGYVRWGDKIRRVKGGFTVIKQNLVDQIYKYKTYYQPFVPCNFQKWTYESENDYYIGYEFGCNWSVLPEPDFIKDIWIPF